MPLIIRYTPAAARDLRALRRVPAQVRDRIRARIEALAEDPTPAGSVQLRGSTDGERRVRVGDYRIRYRVEGQDLFVTRVRHRREVYR